MNDYQDELIKKSQEIVKPVPSYMEKKLFKEIASRLLEDGFLTIQENNFYYLRDGVVKTILKIFPEMLEWWQDASHFIYHCIGPYDYDWDAYLSALTEIVHRFIRGRNQQNKIDKISHALKYGDEKEIHIMIAIFVAQRSIAEALIKIDGDKLSPPLEEKVEHAFWNKGNIPTDVLIKKLKMLIAQGLSNEEILNELLNTQEDGNSQESGHQEDMPTDLHTSN